MNLQPATIPSRTLLIRRLFNVLVLPFRRKQTEKWQVRREDAITQRILTSKKVIIEERLAMASETSAGIQSSSGSFGIGGKSSDGLVTLRRIEFNDSV